ncbi:MAG: HesB/IscA family protein [Flavisolibacter sp.]
METLTQSPIKFTEGACNELHRLMNEPGFDKNLTLRLGVKGGGCSGLSYILNFDEKKENDREYEFEDLRFVIDKAHELYLYGMEVDWQGGLNSRGFTFQNPNASKTCGCGTSFAV